MVNLILHGEDFGIFHVSFQWTAVQDIMCINIRKILAGKNPFFPYKNLSLKYTGKDYNSSKKNSSVESNHQFV